MTKKKEEKKNSWYIVTQRGWEYNDEYNILSDTKEIASKLYKTKKEAKDIGLRAAILSLYVAYGDKKPASEVFDFRQFGYEDVNGLIDWMTAKGYPVNEDYELYLPKGLSEDEMIEAYEQARLGLFEIVEIEEA